MKKLLIPILLIISTMTNAQPWLKQISDINPGGTGSFPRFYYPYNGKLYFTAFTDALGYELYVTDGTTAGTQLIKDINTNNSGFDPGSYPQSFAELNGKLYFSANDNGQPNKGGLWVTDGTTAGTQKVFDVDINTLIKPLGNQLIFAGLSNNHGYELWASDGATGGTHILKEINPTSNGSYPRGFTYHDGKLYFSAHDYPDNQPKPFVTDGTEVGTHLLKDIRIKDQSLGMLLYNSDSIKEQDFISFNNKLYFAGVDPNVSGLGFELWQSDGTDAGTNQLKDIAPASAQSNPGNFTISGNKLFFTADSSGAQVNTNNEWQLWVTDGTSSGTIGLTGTMPFGGGDIVETCPFNDNIYFKADQKIWMSDGTEAGTTKLVDTGYNPRNIFTYNGKLYFCLSDSVPSWEIDYMKLYTSDGTRAGTKATPFVFTSSVAVSPSAFYYCNHAQLGGDMIITLASENEVYNPEVWAITAFASGVTDIKNLSADKLLYPNPATNSFSIKNIEDTIVEIYDLTGKLLMETSQTQNISIRQLPAGTYLVQITTNGKTSVEKLIKQ